MVEDFEQLLKSVFGDQVGKVTSRLQEMAREAVKEDIGRLQQEITDLRTRLARIEQERAQAAAESLETSF